MHNYIKTALTVLCAAIALITFNLGMDYINFGYGLHPFIAFPIMTVASILGATAHMWADIVHEIQTSVDEYVQG